MNRQQVLTIITIGPNLRSMAEGWSCEDPTLFRPGEPIGRTPAPRFAYTYDTVLAALADGWRLLAPPAKDAGMWEWWLVREVGS